MKTTNSDSIPTLAEIHYFTKILNNQNEFSVPIYISIKNKHIKDLHKSDQQAVRKTQLFQISEKHVTATDLLLDLVTSGLNRSMKIYHYKLKRHWDLSYVREESEAFYQKLATNSTDIERMSFDRVDTVFPNIITHSPFGYSLVTDTKSHLKRRSQFFEYHFPLVFAGFQLQLEQGTDSLININLRQYWKTIPLTFPLFLATIVLTNAFKGDNIMNIISPPADKPFINFRDLYSTGFTFYSKTLLRSTPQQAISTGTEFNFIRKGILGPTQTYVSEISPDQYDEIVSRMDLNQKTLRLYRTLEEVLEKNPAQECLKIAILAWTSELRLIQDELSNFYSRKRKNKIMFSLGHQFLFTQLQGWKISHIVDDSVQRRVQDLIQFGFLDKILWYQNQSQWLSRRANMASFPQRRDDEGVKLYTNVQNVLLYFVLFQVAIISLTVVSLITTKLFATIVIYLVMRRIAARNSSLRWGTM
ncbi:hypothetical protein Fcan01_23163 [Folsomia candida]|uniref:Uncharacterized protein n=1 Tax=Folsomia candida TaxID=158441 RepID=A0A226DBX8_FOLCA|nr:hypothetical protein Fcan01_23163 [Folsomia candida]